MRAGEEPNLLSAARSAAERSGKDGCFGHPIVSALGKTMSNDLQARKTCSEFLASGARMLFAVSWLLVGPTTADADDMPLGSSGRPAWAEHAAKNAMKIRAPEPSVEEPPPVIPEIRRIPRQRRVLGTY